MSILPNSDAGRGVMATRQIVALEKAVRIRSTGLEG